MENTRNWSRESIEAEIASQFSKTILKFGLAIFITFLTVFSLVINANLMSFIYGNQFLMLLFPVVQIIIVITMSLSVYKMQSSTLTMFLILYSVLTGLTITPYVYAYSGVVLKALFTTVVMFLTMGIYGFFTKNKVYKLDRILSVSIITLIILSLGLFIFSNNKIYDMGVSIFGAIIFLIYTVYDVQVIKKTTIMMIRNSSLSGANQIMDNIATINALKLYLDFINLFIYIVRIFAGRSRD